MDDQEELVQATADEEPGSIGRGDLSLRVVYGDAEFSAEGPGYLILQAFAAFREHIEPHKPSPRRDQDEKSPKSKRMEDTEARATDQAGTGTTEPPPLAVFIKQLKPKGNPRIAAAIAVWAQRYGNESELSNNRI